VLGGYRGNLRADVDGDGMISSWDQLRFAQHQSAWFFVYLRAVIEQTGEDQEGWSSNYNLSRFHPHRKKGKR